MVDLWYDSFMDQYLQLQKLEFAALLRHVWQTEIEQITFIKTYNLTRTRTTKFWVKRFRCEFKFNTTSYRNVVGQGSGQGTSATSSCEDNIEYNGPCITNKCPLNGISSIDSCKDLCDADSQCTALVYDGISNLCTLKYARGSALTVPSALEINKHPLGREVRLIFERASCWG